jgi:hypothetical protein
MDILSRHSPDKANFTPTFAQFGLAGNGAPPLWAGIARHCSIGANAPVCPNSLA